VFGQASRSAVPSALPEERPGKPVDKLHDKSAVKLPELRMVQRLALHYVDTWASKFAALSIAAPPFNHGLQDLSWPFLSDDNRTKKPAAVGLTIKSIPSN
jgi:hypothetical protein